MKLLATLLLCLLPSWSWGVSSELTRADTALVSAGKKAIIAHLGSSTGADTISVDSLTVSPGGKLTIPAGVRPTLIYIANDTINSDSISLTVGGKMAAPAGTTVVLAHLGAAATADTIAVDSLTVPAGGKFKLVLGSTAAAGRIRIDTIATDSLTVPPAGKVFFMKGSVFSAGKGRIDSIATDSLTVPKGGKHAYLSAAKIDSLGVDSLTVSTLTVTTLRGSATSTAALNLKPDSTWIRFPDTTVAKSAKQVIPYSLYDPAFCYDYNQFRRREKNTSWYKELGSFPAYGIIIAANGTTDSVTILDALSGKTWMTFKEGSAFVIASSTTVGGMGFMDGVLVIPDNSGNTGVMYVNFLDDTNHRFGSDSQSLWMPAVPLLGDITNRNATGAYINVGGVGFATSFSRTNVSFVRSPLKEPPGLLPRLYFAAPPAGANKLGVYNPYSPATGRIWDATESVTGQWGATTPRGSMFEATSDATRDDVQWWYSIFSAVADGYGSQGYWDNTRSGSEDLRWGNATVFNKISAVDGVSIAGNNSPVVAVAADSGLMVLHGKIGDNTNGAEQEISKVFNSGYMFGNAVLCAPLESVTFSGGSSAQDASAQMNNLSLSGTHTLVNGIIGKADSLTNSGFLYSNHGDADFNYGVGSVTFACWVKSHSVTQSGTQIIMSSTLGPVDFYLAYNASGQFTFVSASAGNDAATTTGDLFDAKWHHVVGVKDGISSITLYVDGREMAQDASIAGTGAIDVGTLYIGNYSMAATSNYFLGSVDQPQVMKGIALTADQVMELYNQGQAGFQSSVSVADALPIRTDSTGYVQIHSSGVMVAGNQDSFTVFDRYGIPQKRYGSPGGLIKDVAFMDVGGDSLGLVVGTSTMVQTIIPDVLVSNLAVYQWPAKPIDIGGTVVVDSAGIGGIFGVPNDAFAAAKSWHIGEVYIAAGIYPVSQILSQDSLKVVGAGPKTIFDGGNTSIGFLVSGTHNRISNISAKTTVGGSGGFDAWSATGADNSFDNIFSPGADDDCFNVTGARTNIRNSFLMTCDDDGADFDGTSDNSLFVGNRTLNTGGQGVQTQAGADQVLIAGNRMDGAASVSGTADSLTANHNTSY